MATVPIEFSDLTKEEQREYAEQLIAMGNAIREAEFNAANVKSEAMEIDKNDEPTAQAKADARLAQHHAALGDAPTPDSVRQGIIEGRALPAPPATV